MKQATETGARSQGRWEQEEQEFSDILCCRAFEGAQAKRSSISKKQKTKTNKQKDKDFKFSL